MRQYVKSNLVRINFFGDGFAVHNLLDLPLQLCDRLRAGSRNRLVARSKNSFYKKCLVQGIERHQGDGRSAIRVGDDAVMQFDVGSVNFRNHQRDFFIHPERARIIDHHATGFGGQGREFFRDAAAGAEQRDVDPAERIPGQLFDGDLFPAKCQLLAHGTG